MKILLLWAIFISLILFTASCSLMVLQEERDFGVTFAQARAVTVVVDASINTAVAASLATWQADLAKDGIEVRTIPWAGGTAEQLKQLLKTEHSQRNFDGTFLVGNLPAAWYELMNGATREEFPCDIYLMDLDSEWADSDQNGRYDLHSNLATDIYVSRVTGTTAEINHYFSKNHQYRSGALSMPQRALIFKDDDWSTYKPGSHFGLARIYETVEIMEKLSESVKPSYLSRLASNLEGSEFVNQWIHALPDTLFIAEDGEYNTLSANELANRNVKGLFFNLYNCSAARFTENNLSMTYLTKTDWAIATLGSTKPGGAYQASDFYDVLAQQGTWGEAFKTWYNNTGKSSDTWFLGMVIQGDPTLKVHSQGIKSRLIDSRMPAPALHTEIISLENSFSAFLGDFQPKNKEESAGN